VQVERENRLSFNIMSDFWAAVEQMAERMGFELSFLKAIYSITFDGRMTAVGADIRYGTDVGKKS
jgi:hypothetical protein